MEKGDQIELDITGVAHGGVFVAREPEGRVVFVADAIPGERVRARITEVKKSFARAETVDVLDASPDRVPHVWPAVAGGEQPGGADLGHGTRAASPARAEGTGAARGVRQVRRSRDRCARVGP